MSQRGALFYENYKRYNESNAWYQAEEYLLFTNKLLFDVVEFGPYQLMFTGDIALDDELKPSHVLRVKYAIDISISQIELETKADGYTGRWVSDEFVALASLILGVKIKSSRSVRIFTPDDLTGHPYMYFGLNTPYLPKGDRYRRNIIPDDRNSVDVKDLNILSNISRLTPGQSISLARAGLLFQEALWISESYPEQSWIYLVSAVESIAVEWDPHKDDPVEKLKVTRRDIYDILYQFGEEDLIQRISPLIAPYMGATNKFIKFILEFCPVPPENRAEFGVVDYDNKKELKSILKKVYAYRSSALHAGIPFPAPMCAPPIRLGDTNGYSETIVGLSASTLGSTWSSDDAPILLHAFCHIARGAILNWLRKLLE